MKRLLLLGLAAGICYVPVMALAGEIMEEVVVTGSYIKGTPEDAASPVDVISREEMDMKGNPSIIEMLRAMGPIAGIDGETNQFQSNGLEAISNVNLRGLGAGRTLVLFNSTRVVPNPFFIGQDGQQFVNTNVIPAIALSRIELLKDGASATYGSDAVAGVVNFITRSDFRGVEFQGGFKSLDDGEDDGDCEAGVIVGFGTDRLDVVISGSYQYRTKVLVRNKDWALQTFEKNSAPGGYSAIGNPGSFLSLATGAFPIVDPDCETIGGFNKAGFCRFRYTDFFNISEEEDHYQIFTEATYDISDTMTLHAEFLYAHDEADGNSSPSYPPQALLSGDQIVVPGMPHYDDFVARHPELADEFAAGALFWGRNFGNAGPAGVTPREYDTYRLSLGLS